jgi:ArsR family transcriptional regulator, arsenate/arsenite/antimonite-responsive transcriptional repressor
VRKFMEITKALADESRVRVLMILSDRELCVCQIIELLGLAPSTVSKHMAILKQARLVETRKAGRWIHYRRAQEVGEVHVVDTLAWLDATLQDDLVVQEDMQKLAKILKIAPEEICRRQGKIQ